jgi:CRISPR-associated protein Cas2
MELTKIINEEEDSVIFYSFRTTKYSKRESIGVKKEGIETWVEEARKLPIENF